MYLSLFVIPWVLSADQSGGIAPLFGSPAITQECIEIIDREFETKYKPCTLQAQSWGEFSDWLSEP